MNMKKLLITVIIADILFCGWIALQIPITKWPTNRAIERIERRYMRNDLTAKERDEFEFDKSWILGNQTATSSNLQNIKVSALVIGALLLVQNIVILSALRKT